MPPNFTELEFFANSKSAGVPYIIYIIAGGLVYHTYKYLFQNLYIALHDPKGSLNVCKASHVSPAAFLCADPTRGCSNVYDRLGNCCGEFIHSQVSGSARSCWGKKRPSALVERTLAAG